MLTSYAYASKPCKDAGSQVVDEIVHSAAERNASLGVTGALYSDGETFFQVIEGEEPILAKLMSSILRDPRHGAITILDQIDLEGRSFHGFAIKHVDGSQNSALRERFGFHNLTSHGEQYIAERVFELARF